MYGEVQTTFYGSGRRTTWKKMKVGVPRCRVCQAAHGRARALGWACPLAAALAAAAVCWYRAIPTGSSEAYWPGVPVALLFACLVPVVRNIRLLAFAALIAVPLVIGLAGAPRQPGLYLGSEFWVPAAAVIGVAIGTGLGAALRPAGTLGRRVGRRFIAVMELRKKGWSFGTRPWL
jgi:hypothetical protein